MSSMRYVRGGSGRSQSRSTNSWASNQGRDSRGRGRASVRGRGRFSHSFLKSSQPVSSVNKWVRGSGEATAAAGTASADTVDSIGQEGHTNDVVDHIQPVDSGDVSEHEVPKSNSFERRGKHKLVLKKGEARDQVNVHPKVDNSLPSDSNKLPEEHLSSERKDETVTSQTITLERVGANKLVKKLEKADATNVGDYNTVEQSLISNEGASQGQVNTSDEKVISETLKLLDAIQIPTALERRGKNKLVLKKDVEADYESSKEPKSDQGPTEESRSKPSCTWPRQSEKQPSDITAYAKDSNITTRDQPSRPCTNADVKKRKRRPQYNKSSGSRRICLNSSEPTAASFNLPGDESKKESDHTTDEVAAGNATNISNKNLTDFCYRDTGRGRGHTKNRGGTTNIGLVRVKPEIAATPICPTFRRGLPCDNPKCTLRHDVSSEASRPICVFFQKNGMCSKGDECMFRHVKVRWDAEVCATFERLGYCEDADCVLRHVVAKKSKSSRP
ncbi:hypothetical protein ACHAXN_008171 [Cyclotella atomus]|jgi:hypothetical protein